jgi:hypothetical protein
MSMIFMPNMTQMKLDIKNYAPNRQASDILEYLRAKIMQTSEAALDIPQLAFDLKQFHLVDTNMDSVTDLSWYMTLPPEQLALFVMHDDQYKQGKMQKQTSPEGFNFNAFVKLLMQQQQAKTQMISQQSTQPRRESEKVKNENTHFHNVRPEPAPRRSEEVMMSEDDDTSSEKDEPNKKKLK